MGEFGLEKQHFEKKRGGGVSPKNSVAFFSKNVSVKGVFFG